MMLLFFGLICANVGGQVRITKEFYRQHYKPFEAYIFDKRSQVLIRKIPIIGEDIVKSGAKFSGYDDFAIKCIPESYSFFDRDENDIKNILYKIESDQCMQHVNMLLDKCREKPGDLNWVVRMTYQEGQRLEQEKIKQSQQSASQEEKDTFIAIGFWVRYVVKNKLAF